VVEEKGERDDDDESGRSTGVNGALNAVPAETHEIPLPPLSTLLSHFDHIGIRCVFFIIIIT